MREESIGSYTSAMQFLSPYQEIGHSRHHSDPNTLRLRDNTPAQSHQAQTAQPQLTLLYPRYVVHVLEADLPDALLPGIHCAPDFPFSFLYVCRL